MLTDANIWVLSVGMLRNSVGGNHGDGKKMAVCIDEEGVPLADLQEVLVGGGAAANHIDSHWLWDHGQGRVQSGTDPVVHSVGILHI